MKRMLPQQIQALFDFIDYLELNKSVYIERYIPLCAELTVLDNERSNLKPNKNYIDKQRYDHIQDQIKEKFAPIKDGVYLPILNKLKELQIWLGDDVYTSIWNNNILAISNFKQDFTTDDVVCVINYKQKYLNFRKETNTNFLCLPTVFQYLDEIYKELFDFFKDTHENEFDHFETKTIPVASIEEALNSLHSNKGKNIKFAIPLENLFEKPNEHYNTIPTNRKIEIIMGDKFENIHNSSIYNRSTFTEAFNTVKANYNDDAAQALEVIKLLVEKSENKEAGELFDSFNDEILKDKPKKSVLSSLWNGLIKLVPMITQTVGLAEKILPLLN